jgi:hypothetical protein
VISRKSCERSLWKIGNVDSWERNKQVYNFSYGDVLNRRGSSWKPKEKGIKIACLRYGNMIQAPFIFFKWISFTKTFRHHQKSASNLIRWDLLKGFKFHRRE